METNGAVEISDLETRINRALDKVRPYLMIDGGGVELVSVDIKAGIVEVALTGACETCALAPMTLRAGIERAILREAPEVVRIESKSIIR
jgi:Fe-S cluster biogenesis protein NfuA